MAPPQVAKRSPGPVAPLACLSAPLEPLSQAPLPDPGDPRHNPESAVGAAPSLSASLGAGSRRRPSTLAPRAPGSGSGPLSEPRRRGPRRSRPGPRSPRAQYSPPTRYMLAAMAVPAAASGRTKGSGRLAGVGLGSRRSPERGAGAPRKSRSSPRSRHLRCLSRRGSSRSALSPPLLLPHTGDAEAGAGPLGFFRNKLGSRRPRARLRSLPPSQNPTRLRALPAAGKADPARLGARLLPEHLRSTGRTRPGARLRSESETPQIGHFRKQFGSLRPTGAPRSVISVAAPPRLRRQEELGLTLSSREPCRSSCGPERLASLRFAGLFASGFACHLHEWSTLPYPFLSSLSYLK